MKETELRILFIWREEQPMIAIDREDCYDKIWKCPILVKCPETKNQVEELNKKIEWLRTKRGFNASNRYTMNNWMSNYKRR